MKRLAILPLVALALAACAETPTSLAPSDGPSLASVHLKGGANAEPAFTDGGLTLTSSAELSGLGNGDVFIALSALANATAVCINPGSGAHEPPGQNPAPVTVTGGVAIPEEEIKNGNLAFSVSTLAPANNPRPAAAGECPNPNWTYAITDLSFTSAVITVHQPSSGDPANPGPTVLTVSCTFSPPTSNGPVPARNVTCRQS